MPSWWMPLSCANAFRPTIALLYCTGNDVTADTSFEARVSMVVSMPVSVRQHVVAHPDRHHDLFQRRVARALADAVDGAFDLPRAAFTPASELATAMPRSLWQCTENTALSEFGTRSRTMRNSARVFLRRGVADRVGDVDRGGAGLDRGLDAAAQEIDARCGCRPRPTTRRRRRGCARASPARSPSPAPRAAPSAACISCAPARWR
jgi:hypothetical protein